ncbi:MAG TPA: hypothetical protein VGO62_03675 [Myxococcota bacterium]
MSAVAAACAQPEVSVEVLPPRTSITCDAPTVDDPALGSGLLDAKATAVTHGGYLADLLMVVPGENARVDGIDVKLTRDGTEVKTISNVPTGDVDLVGSKDDIRKSVVENVSLIPRDVALDFAKDSTITELEFASILVEIAPRVLDGNVAPVSSTFALNVCNGCLVDQPPADQCATVAKNQVCRVGQDAPSFLCAAAATGNP